MVRLSKVESFVLRLFVVAPIAGGVIGVPACLLGASMYGSAVDAVPLAILYGLLLGPITGFVMFLLLGWLTLEHRLRYSLLVLGGCTVAFAIPGALVGGPGMAWFGGMLGYMIGTVQLAVDAHRRRVQGQAPISEVNCSHLSVDYRRNWVTAPSGRGDQQRMIEWDQPLLADDFLQLHAHPLVASNSDHFAKVSRQDELGGLGPQ